MAVHIIIDGYNLIRQSDSLRTLDMQDIQMGRDALVEILAEYKKLKKHKITVVFDGTDAPFFLQHRDRVKGIEIKFSRKGELADDLIKKMAGSQREKALVVSSDRDIINFSESHGAATIGSREFESKMEMASFFDFDDMETEENQGWVPTTKKKGPSKRPSKRKRRNRVKTRKL